MKHVTHFLACLATLGTTCLASAQDFNSHRRHHLNPPDVPAEIAVLPSFFSVE